MRGRPKKLPQFLSGCRKSKTKKCSICAITKPIAAYAKNEKCLFGVRPECKKCLREKSQKHREKLSELWANGSLVRPPKKRCPKCKQTLPAKLFTITSLNKSGLYPYCKSCTSEKYQEYTSTPKGIVQRMWSAAKQRAKVKHLKFNLEISDIIVPEFCPALGIKINRNNRNIHRDNSPSLDRIHNQNGYVKGNIVIVSHKANVMKNNGTSLDLIKLGKFYARLEKTTAP